MPIAEVGTGTGAAGTYGTGFTVSNPGTLSSSDIVLIVLRTESSTDPAFTATGFTEIFQQFNDDNNTTNITVLLGTGFTGTSGFAVSSPSLGSGDWVARTCTAWSGTDGVPIVGTAYAGGPGGSDFTIPSITTTVADAVVLAVGGQIFSSVPRTFTPTFTAEAGNDGCFQASLAFATPGATGTVSVANSQFNSAVALLIGLQEPSGASYDRTATGDGTGASTGVNWVRAKVRTASGSGTGDSTNVNWLRIRARTATGSGTGASTSAETVSFMRTATGSGTGGATVVRTISILRTATGSGTGDGTADWVGGGDRTATGSGTGGSISTETVSFMRTATASGTGSSVATFGFVFNRTATGEGTSSQYAQAQRILRIRIRPTFRVGKQFYRKPLTPPQRTAGRRLTGQL